MATDSRNDEATHGAYPAADHETEHACSLLQPRRIGIVRAKVAERAEASTEGQAADASRTSRMDPTLSFHGADHLPREGSNCVGAANAEV